MKQVFFNPFMRNVGDDGFGGGADEQSDVPKTEGAEGALSEADAANGSEEKVTETATEETPAPEAGASEEA